LDEEKKEIKSKITNLIGDEPKHVNPGSYSIDGNSVCRNILIEKEVDQVTSHKTLANVQIRGGTNISINHHERNNAKPNNILSIVT
jgi:hypothetical protein